MRSFSKREVVVTNDEDGDSRTYLIPFGTRLKKEIEENPDGVAYEAGDPLTEGSINPHDLLKVRGPEAVQDYLLNEVQKTYRQQGVDICDKHIEVIVRQMLRKARIDDPGDTGFMTGRMVDYLDVLDANDKAEEEGTRPATYERILLGITKASLATDSFLSAASFQETTRVLTDAAIKGKTDRLVGLKENVIIGKLIPAGTGMKYYRNLKLNTDAEIEARKAAEEAAQREADEEIISASDGDEPQDEETIDPSLISGENIDAAEVPADDAAADENADHTEE